MHIIFRHRTLQSIAWAGDLEGSMSLPGRASGRHRQLDDLMAEEQSNAELLGEECGTCAYDDDDAHMYVCLQTLATRLGCLSLLWRWSRGPLRRRFA